MCKITMNLPFYLVTYHMGKLRAVFVLYELSDIVELSGSGVELLTLN